MDYVALGEAYLLQQIANNQQGRLILLPVKEVRVETNNMEPPHPNT